MSDHKDHVVTIYGPDKETQRLAKNQYIEYAGAVVLIVLFYAGMIPIFWSLAKNIDATQIVVSVFATIGVVALSCVVVGLMMKGLDAERQEHIQKAQDEGRIVNLPCLLWRMIQDEVRAASCDDKCMWELAQQAVVIAAQRPADVSAWSVKQLEEFCDSMADHHNSMTCPASTH